MTLVVLVVLAVIWAAVLIPPLLRDRVDSHPADSIGRFRRQLNVLQRTAPSLVRPANSLRSADIPAPAPVPTYHLARRWSPDSVRRARTLKRRRDVLATLLMLMGGTLVLGLLPPLRKLWVLHAFLDALFVAYVVMLVRARNLAAERDMKLRFLPAPAQADNVLLFRRSAN